MKTWLIKITLNQLAVSLIKCLRRQRKYVKNFITMHNVKYKKIALKATKHKLKD